MNVVVDIRKVLLSLMVGLLLGTSMLSAQVTRGELLKMFYRVTMLENSGDTEAAIQQCESIIQMYPRLPDVYLRLAKIYDKQGNYPSAVVMYCQYMDLELDDNKVKEIADRVAEISALCPDYTVTQHALPDRNAKTNEPSSKEDMEKQVDDLRQKIEEHQRAIDELQSILHKEQTTTSQPAPESDAPRDNVTETSEVARIESLLMDESTGSHNDGEKARAGFCDRHPFIFDNVDKNRLERYGLNRESLLNQVADGTQNLSDWNLLAGKWISSDFDEETGTEALFLSLDKTGKGLIATLSDGSSLFQKERRNLFRVSWEAIKSIWTPHERMVDLQEFANNSADCSVDGMTLSFVFTSKQQKSTNYVTLSKTIVESAASLLPMGDVVSKLGNAFISYLSGHSTQTTYQTMLSFTLRYVSPNELNCQYAVREKKSTTGNNTEQLIKAASCRLFRVSNGYEPFQYVSDNSHEADAKHLYSTVAKASNSDREQLYPLAFLDYYGVGADRDVSKSINRMKTLATKTDCDRAKAWLVRVCYNLSLDNDHLSRQARKMYRDYADNLLKDLLKEEYVYAYTLKAEILSNEDPEANRSAIMSYYEKAASVKGKTADAAAFYRLGMIHRDQSHNMTKAADCFLRAAELGYGNAWLELARFYREGQGVEKDMENYVKCLYKAIDLGSTDAFLELSEAYFSGIGLPHNEHAAVKARRAWFMAKDDVWRDVLNQYGYDVSW